MPLIIGLLYFEIICNRRNFIKSFVGSLIQVLQLKSYFRIGQAQLPTEAVIVDTVPAQENSGLPDSSLRDVMQSRWRKSAGWEILNWRGPQDNLREWEPHNSAQDWCRPVETSDYNRHYRDRQTLLAEHKSLPSRSKLSPNTSPNIPKKWISNDNFHSHFIYHHPTSFLNIHSISSTSPIQ